MAKSRRIRRRKTKRRGGGLNASRKRLRDSITKARVLRNTLKNTNINARKLNELIPKLEKLSSVPDSINNLQTEFNNRGAASLKERMEIAQSELDNILNREHSNTKTSPSNVMPVYMPKKRNAINGLPIYGPKTKFNQNIANHAERIETGEEDYTAQMGHTPEVQAWEPYTSSHPNPFPSNKLRGTRKNENKKQPWRY